MISSSPSLESTLLISNKISGNCSRCSKTCEENIFATELSGNLLKTERISPIISTHGKSIRSIAILSLYSFLGPHPNSKIMISSEDTLPKISDLSIMSFTIIITN